MRRFLALLVIIVLAMWLLVGSSAPPSVGFTADTSSVLATHEQGHEPEKEEASDPGDKKKKDFPSDEEKADAEEDGEPSGDDNDSSTKDGSAEESANNDSDEREREVDHDGTRGQHQGHDDPRPFGIPILCHED